MMQFVVPHIYVLFIILYVKNILILNTHFSSIPTLPFLRNYYFSQFPVFCYVLIAPILTCGYAKLTSVVLINSAMVQLAMLPIHVLYTIHVLYNLFVCQSILVLNPHFS
jgi:hypothetical protein